MKKILILALAVIMVAIICVSESMAICYNHLVDEGYPVDSASTWELMCWTVSDTEIKRVGYSIDEGDTNWVITEIGHYASQSSTTIKPNDCFRDDELEAAVFNYSMSGGLASGYAYRIHITIDRTKLSNSKHTVVIMAEFSDGQIDNALAGESGAKVFKIKKRTTTETTPEETTDPAESSDVEESNETVDTNDTVDTNETDGSSEAEVSSEPEESKDPDETKDEQSSEPEESKDPDETKDEDESSEPEGSTEPDETENTVDPAKLERGDCNKDGEVDNKDIVTLFRYVSGNEKEEDETIYDYDQDGEVNNKDVTSLFRAVSTLQ
ncbi:MAG: hypothetical protein IJT49_01470 [Clostridia bacterium]|nr:hypothetical protein [Clostridia bacterium]